MGNQKSKDNKLRTTDIPSIRGARGPRITDYSGIALVAVLAILVVLAIMAASFTVLMNIESKQSKANINSQQLDMLVNSGLEYAKACALGVQPKIAKKLIDFRYGKNKLPGGHGDDDQNNLILMADGIDNNANGIIDEENEGINDPREYSAGHPKGDDRSFSSMMELMNVLTGNNNKLSPDVQAQIRREIPRKATIYSCDMPGSPTLPNKFPSDINCMTTRECRNLLIRANADSPFEPNSAKQMQIAANLIDYRDENHVLSTLGSTYGVEAICFNEILANDETYSVDPSYAFAPWLDNDKDYWIDNCGSADGKRMFYFVDMIYDAQPDDPQNSYIIDPRRAWRINKNKNIGNLRIAGNVTIDFPKTIGKYGKVTKITPLIRQPLPANLPGNKTWSRWNTPGAVIGDSRSLESLHKNLLKVLGNLGSRDGERPKFPENYFRNSLAMVIRTQLQLVKKNIIQVKVLSRV